MGEKHLNRPVHRTTVQKLQFKCFPSVHTGGFFGFPLILISVVDCLLSLCDADMQFSHSLMIV